MAIGLSCKGNHKTRTTLGYTEYRSKVVLRNCFSRLNVRRLTYAAPTSRPTHVSTGDLLLIEKATFFKLLTQAPVKEKNCCTFPSSREPITIGVFRQTALKSASCAMTGVQIRSDFSHCIAAPFVPSL